MSASVETVTLGEGQIALSSSALGNEVEVLEHVDGLHRLGDAALSELPLDPLLEEILDRVQEILDVDTVALLLFDEPNGQLRPRATRGIEIGAQPAIVRVGHGFAGRIAATRAPIFIPDLSHADVVNPALRAAGISSLLGVPLLTEGHLVGVLHAGSIRPRTFTDRDAMVLQFAASRTAPVVERARVHAALQHERGLTIALQRSLLPARLPAPDRLETGARYLPARGELGGDWYDAIALPDDRLGVVIGDVAGHGVAAATLMGQLRVGLRAYALEGHEPGETLRLVNALLLSIDPDAMATALYGVVDLMSGSVCLASAGHLPPILTTDRGARLLDVPVAPPLGARHERPFPQTTVELGTDTLLLYTDGLVERRDESIDVGLERLVRASGAARSPEALCESLTAGLIAGGGAADDVAMLALRLPVGHAGAQQV
jgi:hypothetical protein